MPDSLPYDGKPSSTPITRSNNAALLALMDELDLQEPDPSEPTIEQLFDLLNESRPEGWKLKLE